MTEFGKSMTREHADMLREEQQWGQAWTTEWNADGSWYEQGWVSAERGSSPPDLNPPIPIPPSQRAWRRLH